MNSTILGQRKPKPANRRKKKKHNGEGERERRYSEGEASDYEVKASDVQCNCKSKTSNDGHTKTTNGKGGRQVAANKQAKGADNDKTGHVEFKNGLMFDLEM